MKQMIQTPEQQLRMALDMSEGNVTKAGELLGISRMTVWRRMKKYGLVKRLTVVKGADYPDLSA